jgi:hypothetical protein
MVLLVIGLVSRALRVFDTTFCFPAALRFVLLWPLMVIVLMSCSSSGYD